MADTKNQAEAKVIDAVITLATTVKDRLDKLPSEGRFLPGDEAHSYGEALKAAAEALKALS